MSAEIGGDAEDAERSPPAAATGAVAFLVALVVYIALGLVLKSAVLNWIVGPLFPLFALYLLPAAVGRLRWGRRS